MSESEELQQITQAVISVSLDISFTIYVEEKNEALKTIHSANRVKSSGETVFKIYIVNELDMTEETEGKNSEMV